MDSLLIDNTYNDLLVDLAGNIAVTSNPYQLAQSVACAVRMFKGECRYNTAIGIPYFDVALGHLPPQGVLNSLIQREASRVPGVTNIEVVTGVNGTTRTGYGVITFNDASTGEALTITT